MGFFYHDAYHANRDVGHHKVRYEKELKFLPPLDDERILDIGCARGDFLSHVKDKHPEIQPYGIDYYSTDVNDARVKFFKKDLAHSGFHSDQFDIVTAWAVFEHLHTPSLYFQEIHRILKFGGKFVFLVTNSESCYSRWAYREDVPRHTYHYSEKVLKQYAKRFKFEMTGCKYSDDPYDGKGNGTFRFTLGKLAGMTPLQVHKCEFANKAQKRAWKLGVWLDRLIFKYGWEKYFRRSGIMVVEFTKLRR